MIVQRIGERVRLEICVGLSAEVCQCLNGRTVRDVCKLNVTICGRFVGFVHTCARCRFDSPLGSVTSTRCRASGTGVRIADYHFVECFAKVL